MRTYTRIQTETVRTLRNIPSTFSPSLVHCDTVRNYIGDAIVEDAPTPSWEQIKDMSPEELDTFLESKGYSQEQVRALCAQTLADFTPSWQTYDSETDDDVYVGGAK